MKLHTTQFFALISSLESPIDAERNPQKSAETPKQYAAKATQAKTRFYQRPPAKTPYGATQIPWTNAFLHRCRRYATEEGF